MANMFIVLLSINCLLVTMVLAAPQSSRDDELPQPYEYKYKVENPPTNTYFGQNEAGDQVGRVSGSYHVLLPDGRLMTVEYVIDGESGYVPRISFQQNTNLNRV